MPSGPTRTGKHFFTTWQQVGVHRCHVTKCVSCVSTQSAPNRQISGTPQRVSPKRVNPNFGFTLFGFTLLRYFQIYPRYGNIYNINTKYQAAAGPAQAKGRAGLVFCIYFVYLVYLVYLWIYLDHFFEFFGPPSKFLFYFWHRINRTHSYHATKNVHWQFTQTST